MSWRLDCVSHISHFGQKLLPNDWNVNVKGQQRDVTTWVQSAPPPNISTHDLWSWLPGQISLLVAGHVMGSALALTCKQRDLMAARTQSERVMKVVFFYQYDSFNFWLFIIFYIQNLVVFQKPACVVDLCRQVSLFRLRLCQRSSSDPSLDPSLEIKADVQTIFQIHFYF